MIHKVMTKPEIKRQISRSTAAQAFYIIFEPSHRRFKKCWQLRWMTTPYSSKGRYVGMWRSRLVAACESLDELLEHVTKSVPTLWVYVSVYQLKQDGKEIFFGFEPHALNAFNQNPEKSEGVKRCDMLISDFVKAKNEGMEVLETQI